MCPDEGVKLFKLNFSTSLLKSSFDLLSLCFRCFLFDDCICSLVNELFSLFKTKTSKLFNSFNYAKFSLTS